MSPLENVPRREEDIEEYSESMIAAIEAVKKAYPNAAGAKSELETLIQEYQDKKKLQADALIAYQDATSEKDVALESLVKALRANRKEADQLDTKFQRAWSEQFSPIENTQDLPGAPRDVVARRDGPGIVHMEWRRPKRGTGGKVLFYEVVIKDSTATTGWQIVATTDAQTREVTIKNQPQGMELVYQVFAKNRNGRSPMVDDPINIIL